MKYILVLGSVISGLGKGVSSSSLGVILQEAGKQVTCIKIDPYLNVDAGLMSPAEHGETYVCEGGVSGVETDLDLGNYERFLDVSLTGDHNITAGKIYQKVLQGERLGTFLGKTIQVVPHVTDEIQNWIKRVAAQPILRRRDTVVQPDVCIIELGGCIGDMENAMFLEALRQLSCGVAKDDFFVALMTLVPLSGSLHEPKTKPTQQAVAQLRSAGLFPNMIFCRCAVELPPAIKAKIAASCMVALSNVVSVHDVSNIYKVPLLLMASVPAAILGRDAPPVLLTKWRSLIQEEKRTCRIGLVGKYTTCQDAYLSVTNALTHAGLQHRVHVDITWIDSEQSTPPCWAQLDGILVPGGFGARGTQGMMSAARFARVYRVPFLGICLGLQIAVIDFARSECGLRDADSQEFSDAEKSAGPHVVILMPETELVDGRPTVMGGKMRLGSRPSHLKPDTLASKLYGGAPIIHERHRHRYEVNPEHVALLEAKGLVFSATDSTGLRMEMLELPGHPFYLGTQFHPEFQSRPFFPSPPFYGFIEAAIHLASSRS